jgi:hypothetical protein
MRTHARMLVLPLALLTATVAVAGQVAAGCAFDFADCQYTFGFGCPGGSGAATGAGAGATGSTSSAMTGGGGPGGCTDAAECAVPAGLCFSLGTATCIDGRCVVTYQAGLSPSQQYGSCETRLCDDAGAWMLVPDAGNVYVDDGNSCNLNGCSMGAPTQNTLTQDTMCLTSTMGMGYCEHDPYSGILSCEECNQDDQSTCSGVPGTTCAKGGKCVPAHCTNGIFDPTLGETDVDCGGPCLPCAATKGCGGHLDCASQVCIGGQCQAPSCTDNVQNETETDVDCGGMCQPCANHYQCSQPSDCMSGVCLPVIVGSPNLCAYPTCDDGVQNGGETGIDCGGSCLPCASADAGDAG